MKKIVFFGIGLLSLSSCCKLQVPTVDLRISDTSGENILANAMQTDSTWVWAESNASKPEDIILGMVDNSAVLIFGTGNFQSGVDYYIKVSNSDIDTLNVVYDIKGVNCNTDVKVESVSYNGNIFDGAKKGKMVEVVKY